MRAFDSRKKKTKIINLTLLQNEDFERNKWRNAKLVDAGRWDYLGTKNKGLAGDLGWLNLTLELNATELTELSESGVLEHFKSLFLNYLKAENEDIRSHYPGYSEENLAHALLPTPESFEWIDVNGARMVTWLSNETKGSPSVYYNFAFKQKVFCVNYHFLPYIR